MDWKLCGAAAVWCEGTSVPLNELETLGGTWLGQHRALGSVIYSFYPRFPAAAGGAPSARVSSGIYPAPGAWIRLPTESQFDCKVFLLSLVPIWR